MHVRYQNLREWLIQVKEMGGVKVVEGANIEEDAGRMAEMLSHTENGPAVIMDAIPGYPKGNRLLINTNGVSVSRIDGFHFHKDILKIVA